MAAVREAPRKCPFCGARLEYYKIVTEDYMIWTDGWRHPEDRCVLSLFEVPADEVGLWNRRWPQL